MKIRLAEPIFETLQGEGAYAGVPSLFVRTSSCNLSCWWCDTPYSSHRPEGEWVELDWVIETVAATRCPHVVLTGGEPMLFREQAAALCVVVRAAGKTSTIETNGTIYDPVVRPDLWSVSPKLASSAPAVGPDRETHLARMAAAEVGGTLRRFMDGGLGGVQYKFVVAGEEDAAEVKALVERNRIPSGVVWLMPEGRTPTEVVERGRFAAEVCKREGWRLSLRTHILLWGNKKGT